MTVPSNPAVPSKNWTLSQQPAREPALVAGAPAAPPLASGLRLPREAEGSHPGGSQPRARRSEGTLDVAGHLPGRPLPEPVSGHLVS